MESLSEFVCQACRVIVPQHIEPHRGFGLELLVGPAELIEGMNIQAVHRLQTRFL